MVSLKLYLTVVLIIFLNLQCFYASSDLKIIGGNATTIEKHPWMVSIQFLSVHFCGGSILNENTIITAAHCFNEVTRGITIVAGYTDLREASTSIRVKSLLIHDEYDASTTNNDLAILTLSESLTFSEKIQPISLPEENVVVPADTLVLVSGWGVTSEDGVEPSNILLEIEIPIIDREICRKTVDITDSMMCAGDLKGGRDSCSADSGGPLELNSTLIGIVSWGHGCGEADYPGVYTDVGHFRLWIKQHTGI